MQTSYKPRQQCTESKTLEGEAHCGNYWYFFSLSKIFFSLSHFPTRLCLTIFLQIQNISLYSLCTYVHIKKNTDWFGVSILGLGASFFFPFLHLDLNYLCPFLITLLPIRQSNRTCFCPSEMWVPWFTQLSPCVQPSRAHTSHYYWKPPAYILKWLSRLLEKPWVI